MRKLFAILGAVLGLLLLSLPVAAQESESSGPSRLVVHQVDARDATTEISILADNYDFDVAELVLTQNGENIDLDTVTTATDAGTDQEIVFVVDANSDLTAGRVFETVTTQLGESIEELPAGTTVSVVSAGVVATTVVKPTTDLRAAAQAVRSMRQSNSTSLFEGIRLAGGLLSNSDEAFQTVVVFSGTVDPAENVDPLVAGQPIFSRNAQLVVFRYQAGDDRLTTILDVVGGITVGTSSPDGVAATMREAVTAASDRVVVKFADSVGGSERSASTLTIGSASTTFSYPGNRLTLTVAGLSSVEAATGGGLGALQNSFGLYGSIALAMLGVGLAVYAVGNLFAGGDQSLEGLIGRYAGEGDGVLDDEESAIVQTALIKRAVEMSESFAEDRGFLAKIEGLLERAHLPLRPGEAMSIYVAGIFFSGAIGFILVGGLIGSLIVAAFTAFALIAGVQFRAKRRIRKFEEQLPDTLQLLAGTLRAGYSLPQGLEAVSHEITDPMGFELRRAMTEARLGREIEDSLSGIAERLDSADFAWVVMAIGIQREVGGNLNELLLTVSDTMVARERLKGEVAALTAEGKMSAIMLGGMPPVLGLVMWVMNRDYMNQLFITTMGNVLLGLAIVSSLIGFVWMKKVITVNV